MKNLTFLFLIASGAISAHGQPPVGNWKMLSHMATYDGKTFDSHAALLSQPPCVSKIVYRITSDDNKEGTLGCKFYADGIMDGCWTSQ